MWLAMVFVLVHDFHGYHRPEMSGTPGIHRVRPNHREWTPPQVAFIDTETWPVDTEQGEQHTLRLWAARLDVRRARSDSQLGTSDGWGYSADELADQIDIWTEGQRTLWVYCHNLAFDLSVTRLPAVLKAREWEVTGHAVSSDSPWLRMRRGQCVITFADSWGWLRAPLDHIGADVGYDKPQLPAWDDTDEAWLARCQADVEILARAMLTLMRWWDTEHLGSWTLTGSAGGWNSWRHRTTTELPLIIPGEDQTAADRRAIYGGRREAFQHGQIPNAPFTLLDFKSAYPAIAAALPLPAARQGNFQTLPIDSPMLCGDRFGVIAECVVTVNVPRFPVRVNGRVAYPIGTFATTLAGPELAEAQRLGCLVSIGPGYLHRLSPHMAEWARWVLDTTSDETGQVPRVCQRAVKHWGRAVIGKTAARGWRTIPLETLGGTGWDYRPAWNAELQAPSHLVDVCGQVAEVVAHGDADNAYPAILAWVESWVRVYLSRVLDALGAGTVVSCDTDGCIVLAAADWRSALAQADTGPLIMREKGHYRSMQVIGPQHVIAPGDRKLAGIPRSAEVTADGKLSALLWPGLASQMALRPGDQSAGYVRPRQTYTMPTSTVTGWVDTFGWVRPLQAAICGSGNTHLLPWPESDYRLYPDHLQASHLAEMITPLSPKGVPCVSCMSRLTGSRPVSRASGPIPSSESHQPQISPAAAKPQSWPSIGRLLAHLISRASSGRTRT
jgi:hypothetical protein